MKTTINMRALIYAILSVLGMLAIATIIFIICTLGIKVFITAILIALCFIYGYMLYKDFDNFK